jgi:hypothetical protein
MFSPAQTLGSCVCFYYYYYIVCDAIGTTATPGLLFKPRVIVKMIVEKQMECRLAEEAEEGHVFESNSRRGCLCTFILHLCCSVCM